MILLAFFNIEVDDHSFFTNNIGIDVIDLEIEITLVVIEGCQFFLIFCHLIVFQCTAAGNEGEEPEFASLYDLA